MKRKSKYQNSFLRSQSIVETAIVLPLLFFMVLAMLDFSYIFFTKQTISSAARVAGRIGSTGRILMTNEVRPEYNNLWVTTNRGVEYTWVQDPANVKRPISREQSMLALMEQNLVLFSGLRKSLVKTMTTIGGVNTNVSIKNWSSVDPTKNLGPGERSDDDVTRYFSISIKYPINLLTGLNSIGKLIGAGDTFNNNQFYITYSNVFINETFAYTNVARWTN